MSEGDPARSPGWRPDLAPLRSSRGFRLVFASRTVTAFGTLAVEVTLIVQAKQLTGSPLVVALLGMAELVPLVMFGLYGGVLAVAPGPWLVYGLNAASLVASFGFLTRLEPLPGAAEADGGAEGASGAPARDIATGLRYALRRQHLLGSYLADLSAMIFAYPNALFPFMAAQLHARWATGLMFAAPSAGAFAVTVVSGWMGRVRRHGLAITLAAAGWGLAMAGFGLSPDLYLALGFLVAAGAADMVSGIFRTTLWNQTIPDALRGRLAGVELLSYSVGPPAGQLRSGAVASLVSTRFSLVSGGLLCVGAVAAVGALLPGFIRYRAVESPAP